MGDVQTKVIDRLANLYGPPKAENVDAYLAEWDRALSQYSDDTLEKAVSQVIDENFFPTWPTIAAVKKAAGYFAPVYRPPVVTADVDDRPVTPEERARAARLMEEFRRNMADIELEASAKLAKLPPLGFDDVQRPAFEGMQRQSTSGLHRVDAALTQVSRRITGEHNE